MITFSYPGVSSNFLTTGISSGSELDCNLALGLGCSMAGGEEKGDNMAGGCISLIAAVGSGLFLGLGGLCSWVVGTCGGLGRTSGFGLGGCCGCGGGCWTGG